VCRGVCVDDLTELLELVLNYSTFSYVTRSELLIFYSIFQTRISWCVSSHAKCNQKYLHAHHHVLICEILRRPLLRYVLVSI